MFLDFHGCGSPWYPFVHAKMAGIHGPSSPQWACLIHTYISNDHCFMLVIPWYPSLWTFRWFWPKSLSFSTQEAKGVPLWDPPKQQASKHRVWKIKLTQIPEDWGRKKPTCLCSRFTHSSPLGSKHSKPKTFEVQSWVAVEAKMNS